MGAIIRSAVAFGIDSILLSGETADIYNPKVIRASSGMVLDIPIYKCAPDYIDALKRKQYTLLVSSTKTKNSKHLGQCYTDANVILAFGSEGKGVSKQITRMADKLFHIPISPKAESLNVTIAAAISMYVFKTINK